jgi:isocitrate dehydrogenase (NAD+)
MMLDHVGEQEKSKRVQKAIDDVLLKDKVRTGDLGGKANTKQFTAAVVARVK